MTTKYVLPSQSSLAQKKLEAGWLGKFFGVGDNAVKNGALIIIIMLAIAIICLAFAEKSEALKIVVPVLTLAIGYLFGTKDNN